MTKEIENRALIVQERYDLSVLERTLIERGLTLADSLGKKEYICPILGAKFVLIPAGTFMTGSSENELGRNDDETLHQVKISKPFYLQTTPVTQGQWEKVMGNNPSHFKGDDNLPVERVSWNDVQKFIRKLNKMAEPNKYRLPKDDEWKYACRAGSATVYCYGDDSGRLGEYAWYDVNSGGRSHPVGQKKPNDWGLYDMYGNICEWCQDYLLVFQNSSESVTDPVGPVEVKHRIFRYGSWSCDEKGCRLDDII